MNIKGCIFDLGGTIVDKYSRTPFISLKNCFQRRNVLLDDNNVFICDFIRKVFQYEEDLSLLNDDILKLSLNKMSHINKVELIVLLLDNNVPIYIKQKLQFLSIQLEMNKDNEVCYINTNWKELEIIIYSKAVGN